MAFGQGAPTGQPENTAAACQDRVDNDGDGYIDCQDQDCGMIVTCSGRGPFIGGIFPPRRPRRVGGTGRGLAVGGSIVGGIGVLFMTTAIGVGFIPAVVEGSDDGPFVASMVLGFTGLAAAQVGNGLTLGGLLRLNRTLRSQGQRGSFGAYVAGWVMWGLTMASPAISIGLMEGVTDDFPGLAFIAPFVFGLPTYILATVGWARANARYRPSTDQRQASTFSISPFVTRTSGGTFAGLVGSF